MSNLTEMKGRSRAWGGSPQPETESWGNSVGGRGLGSEKPALGWGREGVSQGGAAGNSWVG